MAENGFFVAALPRNGVVTFLALVREKELKPKRNGGLYLHLLLADRTGELEARVWDGPETTSSLFERDDIVKVRGTIELYNDRPPVDRPTHPAMRGRRVPGSGLLPHLGP